MEVHGALPSPTPPGKSARLRDALGAALASALALAHLLQCVIFSGFRLVPGDIGDGRFNNLVLEHFLQALQGRYPFLSPGQFFPLTHTLEYSDNHWGTAWIYAGFRLLGIDVEGAFVGWLAVICVLNATSLFVLLRETGVSRSLSVPVAFFGVASCAVLRQIDHPQVLPFFPFIWCLFFIFRAWRDGDIRYLAPAFLLFAYQYYCYLYEGLYGLVLLGLLLAFIPFLPYGRPEFARSGPRFRTALPILAAAIFLGTAALVFLFLPYVSLVRSHGGAHPISELISISPRWSSWFTADPNSLLHRKQDFLPTEGIAIAENALFNSWVPWVLVPVAAIIIHSNRRSLSDRFELNLILACLLVWASTLLLFTCWGPQVSSVYVAICRYVAPLRGFRAISRIALLLGVIQAVFAGLVLEHLRSRPRPGGLRLLAVVAAWVLAVDTVSVGEISYDRGAERARYLSIAAQWREKGLGKPLVFAPGYTNQPWYAVQLDAWSAALAVHGATFNGYTSAVPDGYAFPPFLANSTLQNAGALLDRLHLPASGAAIVTDWGPRVDQEQGIQRWNLNASFAPRTSMRSLQLRPLEIVTIPVTLDYRGDRVLDLEADNIFISYRLLDAVHRHVDSPPSMRTRLATYSALRPVTIRMFIQAPGQPGDYTAHLSMVHEFVSWWEDEGFPGDIVSMTVRPPLP